MVCLFLVLILKSLRVDLLFVARSLAGLIIEEAIYGVLESIGDKNESMEDQRWLDVTGVFLPPNTFPPYFIDRPTR